jgi:tRNA G26 N,N-dimethylase Trm1
MGATGLTNDALRALFLPSTTAAPAVAAPAVVAPAAAALDCDDGGVVQEGLARLRTEGTFYNKKSVLQRDLTVLALRTWLHQRQAPAIVLDAMAGSGVRALRYLLEVPQVGTAVANDSSELAVAAIGANALLSGLRAAGDHRYTAPDGSLLESSRRDASAYMHAHAGRCDAWCLQP